MNDIIRFTLATIAIAVCFHIGMGDNFQSKNTVKVETYKDYVASNGNNY